MGVGGGGGRGLSPVTVSSSREEGVVPVDGFAPVVFTSPLTATPDE